MRTLIEPVAFQIGTETWRVFGLRFPTETYSKIVYERALEAAQARETSDLTVLHTRSQPEGEAWLLVIDASDDGWYMEGVDWWPGEPAPLDERTVGLVAQRRAAMHGSGQRVVEAHYEPGMYLRPGGTIDPLGGGER